MLAQGRATSIAYVTAAAGRNGRGAEIGAGVRVGG